MKTIFKTKATNTGGRDGHVKSKDGAIDLPIKMPDAGGKTDGKSTNPEQLFAAAYATCFAGSLQVVATEHDIDARRTLLEKWGVWGLSARFRISRQIVCNLGAS